MDMITLAMAKAYTDSQRLAFVEESKNVVFENVKTDGGWWELNGWTDETPGTIFTVIVDGVEYQRELKSASPYIGGQNRTYLGNPTLNGSYKGATDNGDPFLIDFAWVAEVVQIFTKTPDATISCYLRKETVHTIDQKYIPWDEMPSGDSSGGSQPSVKIINWLQLGDVPDVVFAALEYGESMFATVDVAELWDLMEYGVPTLLEVAPYTIASVTNYQEAAGFKVLGFQVTTTLRGSDNAIVVLNGCIFFNGTSGTNSIRCGCQIIECDEY